ncbi:MAG: Flp pilus assembly protein CpaB [Acidimicrobiales bacterium]|jgi:Flp pilus assembly protein CpaB
MQLNHRFSTRFSFAHGLMVVAALTTFAAVSSVLRDRSATVEVLVADADLSRGAAVELHHLRSVTLPASDPLVVHFLAPGDFASAQIRRPIGAGEPILRSDLAPLDTGLGQRTFSLPVADRVLAGLALATGDRVDVIGIGESGRPVFVVTDVGVARLPAAVATGFGGSLGAAFLTIEVDEQQALALVAALRVADVEIVRSTGAPAVTSWQLDARSSGAELDQS